MKLLFAIVASTVLMIACAPGTAHAEEDAAPAAEAPQKVSGPRWAGPRNALSLELLSLANSGVAVQYERFVAPPWVSLVSILGFRRSGGQDFDVIEADYGFEGRLWLYGKAPFTHYDGRAMIGPYLGVRTELGLIHVSDSQHSLGSTMAFAESISFGVRVAAFGRLEITPSFGMGLRTEADPSGRLAAWTRPEWIRMGITVGVLF